MLSLRLESVVESKYYIIHHTGIVNCNSFNELQTSAVTKKSISVMFTLGHDSSCNFILKDLQFLQISRKCMTSYHRCLLYVFKNKLNKYLHFPELNCVNRCVYFSNVPFITLKILELTNTWQSKTTTHFSRVQIVKPQQKQRVPSVKLD